MSNVYEQFYGDLLLKIFRLFQTVLDDYLITILTKIPGSFTGLAVILTALYVFYVMIQVPLGNISKPKEAVMTCFLLILCNSLIFDALTYISWIVSPFSDLTYKLAGFFVTTENVFSGSEQLFGIDACFSRLGGLMDKTFQFCFSLQPKLSMMDLWKAFMNVSAFFMLITPILVYSLSYLTLCCISLFMSYILWVVGPIFIFCFCFKGARGYFKNWATALLNYALIIIFASLLVGITSNVINLSMKKLYNTTGDFHALMFEPSFWLVFFINLLSIGLLLKVPDIAASLSGGQAGSTAGITGGISAIGGLAASGGAFAMAKGGAFAGKAGAVGAGMGRNAYSKFAPPGVKNTADKTRNLSSAAQRRMEALWK